MSAALVAASAPVGTVVMVGKCRYWFAPGTDQADIDKVIAKAERVKGELPAPKLAKPGRLREPSKMMLRAMAEGELRCASSPVDAGKVERMPKPKPEPVPPVDAAELESVAARYRELRDAEVKAREELHALMRDAEAAGMPQADIARATGWHRQHVHRLLKR